MTNLPQLNDYTELKERLFFEADVCDAMQAYLAIEDLEQKFQEVVLLYAKALTRITTLEFITVQPMTLPKENILTMCVRHNNTSRFDEAMKVFGE